MKGRFLLCFLAYVLTSATALSESHHLGGQIFIVTQGQQTFKLPLVTVLLYDKQTIADFLTERRKKAEVVAESFRTELAALRRVFNDTRNDDRIFRDQLLELEKSVPGLLKWPQSVRCIFDGLPEPFQKAKSDADGNFTFEVPEGSYVLAATAKRRTLRAVEVYNWMISIELKGDKRVTLANDNLSSSGSPESLIETPGEDDEAEVAKAMEGVTIEKLRNWPRR